MLSLFELNEHIRRIVALNFPQPLWITAELAQIGNSKGHFYLDLVQKGEGAEEILAQAQAAMWADTYRQLSRRMGLVLHSILREGLELKMQVRPEFHERYGLKLHIVDIDPEYTLGKLDLQRRQTVEALRSEGLLDRNKSLPLPLALQRIALISSDTAAGKQDFIRQLEGNGYAYRFDVHFFQASVQGRDAGPEIAAAARAIARRPDDFDCVVIVRGGGSRLDLSAFDGLELCRAVAQLPLPVFCGIGHDVDETVLDLVAHRSLKTPTAVAEFIIQHNLMFEAEVIEATESIRQLSRYVLQNRLMQLTQTTTELRWAGRQLLRTAGVALDLSRRQLPVQARQFLDKKHRALEQALQYCSALHPDAVLRRGFSITTKNGKAIASPSDVRSGDTIETRLQDGTFVSKVE